MAFKVNLKTLQTFEISHVGANTTNINIWIYLNFSHIFLYFSQLTLATLFKVLKSISKTLGVYEISYFGYKWPWNESSRLLQWPWKISKRLKFVCSPPSIHNIIIWKTLKIIRKFFSFLNFFVNDVVKNLVHTPMARSCALLSDCSLDFGYKQTHETFKEDLRDDFVSSRCLR